MLHPGGHRPQSMIDHPWLSNFANAAAGPAGTIICGFETHGELHVYSPDGKMIDSHKMQKFVIAIDGARSHWSRNAKMSIDELAEILGALVAKKALEKTWLRFNPAPFHTREF